MGIVEQYLLQLKKDKRRWRRTAAILTVLSLLVASGVSWNLRMTGVTIANSATCGLEEHCHNEACGIEMVPICGFDEAPPIEDPTEPPPVEEDLNGEEPIEEELPEEAPVEENLNGEEPIEEEIPEEEPIEEELPEEAPVEEIPEEASIEEEIPEEASIEEEIPEEASIEETEEETLTGSFMRAVKNAFSGFVLTVNAAELPAADFDDAEVQTHIHTAECYEIVYLCGLEEHIHEISCYSDVTADLEDYDIWAASIPELTGRISEDIVLVAQSQLGCMESALNFEFADDGETRNGITRYGQWYGNPYGPWSNMFTSFCLHYAGFEEVPASSGAAVLQRKWEAAGLYHMAGSYEPLAGDIVFLDKNENGKPEATGIVVDFFDGVLTVIEGDVDNMVAEQQYDAEDSVIIGYGITNPGSRLMMFAAMPSAADDPIFVGRTINYSAGMITDSRSFLIYAQHDGQYYALSSQTTSDEREFGIVGVPITVNSDGSIYAAVENSANLLWTFRSVGNGYYIQNVATGRYLHPGGEGAVLHQGEWPTALQASGNGARFVHTTTDGSNTLDIGIRFNTETLTFDTVEPKSSATTLYFGVTETCTVWLDGTVSGLNGFNGSDNTSYSVTVGSQWVLPNEWKSPDRYAYVLRGWYNVTNAQYYEPGDTVTITGTTVFYADWQAATYDIGENDSHVVDTSSTNSFVTTQVFDYNYLFNILSANPSNMTVSASGHTKGWEMVGTEGKVEYENRDSIEFVFLDHDDSGDGSLALPEGRENGRNAYDSAGPTGGIYSYELGQALFNPDVELPGKIYLGTGDHLFQFADDPDSEYYGYYYYDSSLNAASYNQSEQRFYVYDYLEATTKSRENGTSDFLPLNSPYANTNGKAVGTYTENGDTNYTYDHKYNRSPANTYSNFSFGMQIDLRFYLPTTPGDDGNKDIYGNDLIFSFSGDDDLWVLIDGELVLDIGGIHGAENGEINFATGEVAINGSVNTALSEVVQALEPGKDHTMTIMYLERGSTSSHCEIYFNLAPRYSFSIQKEDVLTSNLLNGAEFSVFLDPECETPAELYDSLESFQNNGTVTNTFTVVNGKATMWGLGAGNVYYIKETGAPTNPDYDLPKGIISMILDKSGNATYNVDILEEDDGLSGGFTVHGFRIDEETQQAYIVATNAPEWVEDVTTVEARKVWTDGSHAGETVTVCLTRIVRNENGKIIEVYRLQEAELSSDNGWTHVWENLPKYYEDDTPIEYGVEEEYVPGYLSKVESVGSYDTNTTEWTAVTDLSNLDTNKTYLLATSSGYLSTKDTGSDTGYKWVTQEEALKSDLAQWKITKSGSTYKLTNLSSQILTFYYGNGRPTDFFSSTAVGENNNVKQYFKFTTPSSNNQFRIFYDASADYYLGSMITSGSSRDKLSQTTTANNGLLFTLYTETTTTSAGPVIGEQAFKITNSPLDDSRTTSLTVRKEWDDPTGDASRYEDEQVTIRLLADGKDTGRTVTVSLKNDWEATFQGLPYYDDNGEVIAYTVEESWNHIDWIPIYGPISTVDGNPPTYETSITNRYRWIDAVELPATGGTGICFNILCGVPLVVAPFVYGFRLRRRHGRRFQD